VPPSPLKRPTPDKNPAFLPPRPPFWYHFPIYCRHTHKGGIHARFTVRHANLSRIPRPSQPGQASLWDLDCETLAQKSEEALNKAMNLITNMAYRASELRDRIPAEFTQAEIEFAVKLDYEAGALLAKAGAEGSISVTLTWERKAVDS
jgi:hypothetical protein